MFINGENLWVVKLSEVLSDRIHIEIRKWFYGDQKTIGDQLQRASDSVGANIIEGCGRHHTLETLRFFYIARASLQETQYWIRRASARNLLEESVGKELKIGYERVSQGLQSLIRYRRHKISQK